MLTVVSPISRVKYLFIEEDDDDIEKRNVRELNNSIIRDAVKQFKIFVEM